MFERRDKMGFNEIKNNLNQMMDDDYRNFVKALISIEKGINDQVILDCLYEQFMENDDLHLLDEEFNDMIAEILREEIQSK